MYKRAKKTMSLIGLLILCVVVGGILYLLNMMPIDNTIKQVIKVVVILILIIYLILLLAALLGLSTGMPPLRIR
jgi:hypothetical protein